MPERIFKALFFAAGLGFVAFLGAATAMNRWLAKPGGGLGAVFCGLPVGGLVFLAVFFGKLAWLERDNSAQEANPETSPQGGGLRNQVASVVVNSLALLFGLTTLATVLLPRALRLDEELSYFVFSTPFLATLSFFSFVTAMDLDKERRDSGVMVAFRRVGVATAASAAIIRVLLAF